MVLVSVLMCSYNHERYISEAIESVLNQTLSDLELIIVDDASTDGSKEIIEKYQAKDPRVRAFFHRENIGISETANQCQSLAGGKFVAFIASDDLWVPSKLEKQVKLLSGNEDKVVWSEGDVIDAQGKPTGQTFTEMHTCRGKPKNGLIYKEIMDDNYICAQSVIYRRDLGRKIRYSDKLTYLGDYQYIADLSFGHKFVFISESLVKYRVHGKNTISRDQKTWMRDRILVRNYFIQRYGKALPRHFKGSLYLKIGEAFNGLGERETARYYCLKALSVDFLSKQTILYLTHALTGAKGFWYKFLFQFYLKLGS